MLLRPVKPAGALRFSIGCLQASLNWTSFLFMATCVISVPTCLVIVCTGRVRCPAGANSAGEQQSWEGLELRPRSCAIVANSPTQVSRVYDMDIVALQLLPLALPSLGSIASARHVLRSWIGRYKLSNMAGLHQQPQVPRAAASARTAVWAPLAIRPIFCFSARLLGHHMCTCVGLLGCSILHNMHHANTQ